jgi:hypothetical protein
MLRPAVAFGPTQIGHGERKAAGGSSGDPGGRPRHSRRQRRTGLCKRPRVGVTPIPIVAAMVAPNPWRVLVPAGVRVGRRHSPPSAAGFRPDRSRLSRVINWPWQHCDLALALEARTQTSTAPTNLQCTSRLRSRRRPLLARCEPPRRMLESFNVIMTGIGPDSRARVGVRPPLASATATTAPPASGEPTRSRCCHRGCDFSFRFCPRVSQYGSSAPSRLWSGPS